MRFALIPLFAVAAISALPRPAAAININELEGSSWYLHIDFATMRDSEAGKDLSKWVDEEVLSDIEDETEVDLRGKLRSLTAFSDREDDTIFELEGDFDGEIRGKLLKLTDAQKKTYRGNGYYHIEEDRFESEDGKVNVEVDSEWYVTFDFGDRIIFTESEKRMKEVLRNGGAIPTRGSARDAIFVLSTEKRLVQAGADAERLRDLDDDDWDSNILKNTKKVGLMVADQDGLLAIDLRLQASERKMAESLRNIVLGLIGLSAFSDDMDPAVSELLRNTNVSLDDNVLRLRVAASSEAFIKVFED